MNAISCVMSLLLTLFLTYSHILQTRIDKKVCYSITNGLSTSSGVDRVRLYRSIYGGCIKVVGPLEITHVSLQENETLDFLGGIREITDYLLIYNVTAEELKLSNLSLIMGNNLFMGRGVMISDSQIENFDLRSLTEVSRGSISVKNVRGFRSISAISFEEFVIDKSKQKIMTFFPAETETQCPPNCQGYNHKSYCWSETECQILKRLRCHRMCADQCILKRSTAVCVKSKTTRTSEYINKVPVDYRFSQGFCLRGEIAFKSVCLRLSSGRTPYVCSSRRNGKIIEITHSNIHDFEDCLIIEGSLVYLPNGDLKASDLGVLKSVRAVTGFIYLTVPVGVESLDFLGNIAYVGGDSVHMGCSIIIFDVYRSNLRSLGWSKLEVVRGRLFFYTPKMKCSEYDDFKIQAIWRNYEFKFFCLSETAPEMAELKSPNF